MNANTGGVLMTLTFVLPGTTLLYPMTFYVIYDLYAIFFQILKNTVVFACSFLFPRLLSNGGNYAMTVECNLEL